MMEGREQPGPDAKEIELQQYLTTLCSDVTLFDRNKGFFTHFIEQIDAQVSDNYYQRFGSLKTDEEKILETWAIKPVHTLKVQSIYKEKDTDQAEFFRQKGNKAFQDKEDVESLVMYSRSIVKAPYNSEECLSLSHGNRSAVLFHLEKYQLCLDDIDLAIECAYPTTLMYKVLDRRGQCYVKMGKYSEALEAFQAAETALSDSTLDDKKMEAWRKDLAKKKQSCVGKADKVQPKSSTPEEVTFFGGKNNALPNASAAVTINESKDAGRYAVITRPVGTGQVLMAEDPYTLVLKSERSSTHCVNCTGRLVAPVACKWCSGATFCSRKCRDEALGGYHRWECKFGDLLKGSGMSLNCDLALRIITRNDLEYFKKLKPSLQEPRALPSEKNPHQPNDYVTVYQMTALEDQRSPEDFLERSLMACFLLKVLQRADFFGRWDDEGAPDKPLTEDELYIGSLLLRNLQVLQFNSHEISGMGYEKDRVNFKEAKNLNLGLALYPTVSFCNHSCYPAVARYFQGTKMVMLSAHPLNTGDLVAENYGPIFTHHEVQQRQRKLLSRYWFKCDCEACRNNWPTYDNMGTKRKLACQTCFKALNLVDPSKTIVKCSGCNTQTDVNQIFVNLSKVDDLYMKAKTRMDEGKREEAIKAYVSVVDTLCKYTVPPVKELHLAMTSLRVLFAARGSIQVRNPIKAIA